MKKILTILLCSASFITFSQKVDLDRFHYNANYLSFPREYVEPRTFGVKVQSETGISAIKSDDKIYDAIFINGFKKVEKDPTVGVDIDLRTPQFMNAETKERVEEVKDKDGKVTSRNYFYSVIVKYNTSGGYSVRGPKSETEEAKAKEEVKEPAKVNKFLQNVAKTVTDATEMKDMTKVAASGSYSDIITYTTKEFTSSGDAGRFYNLNKEGIKDDITKQYVDKSINNTIGRIAYLYGYNPQTSREHLWILDSKNHPEYATQQEAIEAVKELFKTMSATESNEVFMKNIDPLIEYFESLKAKYTADAKPDKKMRYSAFFNKAMLYYWTDRPEDAIKEAEGLIKNDYDEKDGEKIIKLCEELKKEFIRGKMTTRHMKLN
jgi:hypothetical protein